MTSFASSNAFNQGSSPSPSSPFSGISAESLLKFTPLPARIQHHLAKVYVALCYSLSAVALGASFAILPWYLATFGNIGCMVGLSLTPATPENLTKRYAYLGGLGLCLGSGLAPLVAAANFVDPSIVVTALLSSAAIFGCFTVSALTTPRRTYMFLGAYISSATLCLCILGLARVFLYKFDALLSIELYVGLLVLAAYVLYDTQLIVERAAAGQDDHLKHASLLLIDLVGLFARIVIILMRNQEKREEENRRKRKN